MGSGERKEEEFTTEGNSEDTEDTEDTEGRIRRRPHAEDAEAPKDVRILFLSSLFSLLLYSSVSSVYLLFNSVVNILLPYPPLPTPHSL